MCAERHQGCHRAAAAPTDERRHDGRTAGLRGIGKRQAAPGGGTDEGTAERPLAEVLLARRHQKVLRPCG